MYDGDTFFNLSILGRIGLVVLSITLSAMTITLFDGLDLQNVIHLPSNVGEIWAVMSFSDKAWLSSHAKALLGWTTILLSFLMM